MYDLESIATNHGEASCVTNVVGVPPQPDVAHDRIAPFVPVPESTQYTVPLASAIPCGATWPAASTVGDEPHPVSGHDNTVPLASLVQYACVWSTTIE